MLTTSFYHARLSGACRPSYRAGAKAAGGIRGYGAHTSIPLTRVLEVRGLADTLWAFRCVRPGEEPERDRVALLVSCAFAEHVSHLWVPPPGIDWEPADIIEMGRRRAMGQATAEELEVARALAEAARDAAGTAWLADGTARLAWSVAAAAMSIGWIDGLSRRRILWGTSLSSMLYATSAAGYAVSASPKTPTWKAAANAERDWEADCLLEYLEGGHANA